MEWFEKKKVIQFLAKHSIISAAEIGRIWRPVGKASVLVRTYQRWPCSYRKRTGEVQVNGQLPHQITANPTSIPFSQPCQKEGIVPDKLHLPRWKSEYKKALSSTLKTYNAILLSGGVSKGKVRLLFHRVRKEIWALEKIFPWRFQRTA